MAARVCAWKKPHAFARKGLDQTLVGPAVANRGPDGINSRVQCRFRNDPAAPDRGNQVVSADHPVAVANKEFEDVKDLRLDGDEVGIPTQLAPIRIQRVILEKIQQLALSIAQAAC